MSEKTSTQVNRSPAEQARRDAGRRRHYGVFYGLEPAPAEDGRPAVFVAGNCQAEATRILLESSGAVRSFRVPPVHEWTAEDLARAQELLRRTDVLVTQPIRDDYRGLACGTGQLAGWLPPTGRVIVYPVLRFDGLMPYQAIVRSPADPSLTPPMVPYHDLRVLAAADRGQAQPVQVRPSAATLRTLAGMSVQQLRSRETAHGAVEVSGHVASWPVWHTINHPDNATLVDMARRIVARIDPAAVTAVAAPVEREMLGGLRAPVDERAAAALHVQVQGRRDWDPAQPGWVAAHLDFYAAHPEVVAAGMARHAQRLALLGLSAG